MAGNEFRILGDLLREGTYEVPDYQRNYAWGDQQFTDLWEDLENISLQSQSKHYTGSIVVRSLGQRIILGKPFQRFEVIDGQQRLASLTILLDCVCDVLRALNLAEATQTATNIHNEYVQDTSTGVYRLKLNGADDAFLKDSILKPAGIAMVGKEPATPSEKRLVNAKAFFVGKTKRLGFDDLNSLIERTVSRLLFIRYEVGTEVEAGLVFEAMNDRGKPLTQVDKIKNYLIYLAYRKDDTELPRSINESWGEIFRNIMTSERFDEDDLLRYHWIMLTGQSKEYDVHRRLKEVFRLRDLVDLSPVRVYVTSLKEASYVFRELSDPENGFTDVEPELAGSLRALVEGLHRLRTMATFMPLLMASRITCAGDLKLFRQVLRECEVYAFRVYKVGNRRADAGLSAFSEYAKLMAGVRALSRGEIVAICDKIVIGLREWLEYYQKDDEFAANLRRSDFFLGLESYEIKYLLYELEKHKCLQQGEAPPAWDDVEKNTTIEHIWPQTPRGLDSWSEEAKAEHRSCFNRLGNLTLTFWNPELSNKDFGDKQIKYRESNLIVQRELAESAKWDKETIEHRTEEIVKFCMERWNK